MSPVRVGVKVPPKKSRSQSKITTGKKLFKKGIGMANIEAINELKMQTL
jgi:hypothetical protein